MRKAIYTVSFQFYGIDASHTCIATSVLGALYKALEAWELQQGEIVNVKVDFEGWA